jgi:hypothetical protein
MGKWRWSVKKRVWIRDFERKLERAAPALIASMLVGLAVRAQDGNAGISQANTMVRSYFATGVQLMYAVGAILGLIGAVRVYQKWSHGDHDTGKVAASWFGSCIFLVVVATLIQSFFGL